MKQPTWDTPNKMHFNSAFAAFNKQTNLITTGNAYCNTQLSSYIRPYSEVENGGYTGRPGQFMKYDMSHFRYIPEHMRTLLRDPNRKKSYILYEFFIFRNGNREIIGYVLTDSEYKYITHDVICGYGQSYWKRDSAIHECMEYICA